jgi:hypothetical protein
MTKEQWTAETWYQIAMELEASASNNKLPSKVRRGLVARADAAWIMGDFMRGISQDMWDDECRVYQAEDDAMVAHNASNIAVNVSDKQMAFELA